MIKDHEESPLLNHALDEPSMFTAHRLIDSVRQTRNVRSGSVPEVCILEFDGDLTDWLVQRGIAKPFDSWACFHTMMFSIEVEGAECGIIPRTIGGPYAVLIAEQLAASGAKFILGLTSAGRVSPSLPLPCLVVATSAVRDEGTSLHYLPASRSIGGLGPMVPLMQRELEATGWTVRCGEVWTTDAPYRETQVQLSRWANAGVLAVEMQAASLFAFGAARGTAVAVVATVSNAVDHDGEQFDTGSRDAGLRIITACVRAFREFSVVSVRVPL